jgi:hypothetical protein
MDRMLEMPVSWKIQQNNYLLLSSSLIFMSMKSVVETHAFVMSLAIIIGLNILYNFKT